MPRKVIRRITNDRERDQVVDKIKLLKKQPGSEKEIQRLNGLVFDYELQFPFSIIDPDVG